MSGGNSIARRGILLVLSSPSGAGKTTITRALVARDRKLKMSVSVTTRPRRPREVDGKHYHFIARTEFDDLVARGDLLEHAVVFGNCYGTPRGPVMKALDSGTDIISDVDWQGTQQLKANVRQDLVSVFILPPSTAALKRRLQSRAQDSREVVLARMAKSAAGAQLVLLARRRLVEPAGGAGRMRQGDDGDDLSHWRRSRSG